MHTLAAAMSYAHHALLLLGVAGTGCGLSSATILHDDGQPAANADARAVRIIDAASGTGSDSANGAVDAAATPFDADITVIDADLTGVAISCPSPGTPASNYVGCGSERWPIKTGTDSHAASISLVPQPNTIAALVALPALTPDTSRASPTETTLWELKNVTLTELKEESDSDYHLVISDGTHTMIAEIPNPRCGVGSPWHCYYSRARAEIDSAYTVTAAPKYPAAVVTVRGIGFFDFAHGQAGVAPNAIELHPVLQLCFGHNCTPS